MFSKKRMWRFHICVHSHIGISEAGPGRFGRQVFVIDIHHTIPYHIAVLSFAERDGQSVI